jgi:hypothetical protein
MLKIEYKSTIDTSSRVASIKSRLCASICTICFSLFAASASAEEFVEWVGANSGVNWSAAQIEAEGAGTAPDNAPPSTGRMMACRAAIVDAQRNLLESIQGVRVEGTTIVANMMVESDTIKTSVSGVLRGARVVNREPQSDGSCIVRMTAPLEGQFAKKIYDEVLVPEQLASASPLKNTLSREFTTTLTQIFGAGLEFLIPSANAADTLPAPEWQSALDKLSERLSSLEELVSNHPSIVSVKDTGPTGLVLDARGSNFIPSMSPKVRQLRAGVLYPNEAHQGERKERGQLVSLFTRDLDTAKRHPVVGERPLVLKALRTFGQTRTQIVLGSQASAQLKELIAKGFLKDSGVIIVL